MRMRLVFAAVAMVTAVAAPSASARVRPHTYAHTYPVASSLCARVAAGQVPKRLAGDTTQITAACNALGNSYSQALSTYETAVSPISGQVKSTLASLRAALQTARQSHDWSAYQAAVTQAVSTLKGLRSQVQTARQAYVSAIRTARQTFWTTIHALPGAGSLPADSGNPPVPPAPTVPVNA